MKKFDYCLNYKELDLRKQPELYTVGRGEQGVLMVEPYKSEILPHWQFKTPEIATESAEKIFWKTCLPPKCSSLWLIQTCSFCFATFGTWS